MNRSMHHALAGALGLVGLAALASCGLAPAPDVVTLEVIGKRNAPADAAWVAVRDARGGWQAALSSSPGSYIIPTDGEGRYALAVGCASEPPTVTLLHGTAAEARTLTAKCEAAGEDTGCGHAPATSPVSPQAFLFSVDATALATGQRAFTYYHGSPLALDDGTGNIAVSLSRDDVLFFTAIAPEDPKRTGQPDPNGITAFHWDRASGVAPAIHIVGGGTDSNVRVPIDGLVTFTGAGTDDVTARATLKLPHEVRVPLGTAPSARLSYHGVPDDLALMVGEAATMLSATATGPEGEGGGRRFLSAQTSLTSTASTPSLSVALPQTGLSPVERFSDGTLRWTAYHDPVAGAALAYSITTTIGPSPAPVLVWRAIATPRWLSANPLTRTGGTLDYRLPDLRGVSGVDGDWLIPPDATGTWELAALGGHSSDGDPLDLATIMKGHGVEEAGAVLLRAGRKGSF